MKIKNILWVLLISMVPVVELRGAIPVGTGMGLPWYLNAPLCVVGNLLPVPFILLLADWGIGFMKRHRILPGLVRWLERKAERGAAKIRRSAEKRGDRSDALAGGDSVAAPDSAAAAVDTAAVDTAAAADAAAARERIPWGACIGLCMFVAIPLPGTGAWTGALVAALFRMKKRYAVPSIALGVIIAAVIVSLISYGVLAALKWLL